jgi:hypothetical protein
LKNIQQKMGRKKTEHSFDFFKNGSFQRFPSQNGRNPHISPLRGSACYHHIIKHVSSLQVFSLVLRAYIAQKTDGGSNSTDLSHVAH